MPCVAFLPVGRTSLHTTISHRAPRPGSSAESTQDTHTLQQLMNELRTLSALELRPPNALERKRQR